MLAIVVAAPERSGGQYLAQLLASGGAVHVGDRGQPWESPDFVLQIAPPLPDIVVCHLSIPHGTRSHVLEPTIRDLRRAGYSVGLLCPVRNPAVVCKSQTAAGMSRHELHAEENIRLAWGAIATIVAATGCRMWCVPYQELGDPLLRTWLQRTLGLPLVPNLPHVDGDAKYR